MLREILSVMQKSVRLKSFELSSSDIAGADVKSLLALSIGVGWPHRDHDWDILRECGKGLVAVDGIGRVFGTAMWFPHGDDFASVGMVITSPRTQAQGNGRWLMQQILDQCAGRELALNSTKAAYGLYLSLGFKMEATVLQCQGEIVADRPQPGAIDGEILPVSLADIGQIDTQAFGADRAGLLSILARDADMLGIKRDGHIVAYAFRRKFGRGHVIGPMVAANDADAIALTAAHLDALHDGFARVDTREEAGSDYVQFIKACGLDIFDKVFTMSKGKPYPPVNVGGPKVYGLSAQALG